MNTTAQNFALANTLTDWPVGMDYDDIMNGLIDGNKDIIVWHPLEELPNDDVGDMIADLHDSFLRYVAHMTKDLREAIKEGDPQTIADRLASFENQLEA